MLTASDCDMFLSKWLAFPRQGTLRRQCHNPYVSSVTSPTGLTDHVSLVFKGVLNKMSCSMTAFKGQNRYIMLTPGRTMWLHFALAEVKPLADSLTLS